MALGQGLELARELQVSKLVVQLDNIACMCASLEEYVSESSWEVKVIRVYREGTRVTDWLASHGVAQPQRVMIVEHIPIALTRLLDEDIRWVAFHISFLISWF